MKRVHAVCLLLSALSGMSSAAELPLQPTRQIEFDTTEGTWISLDVSRDGKSSTLR